MNSRIRFALAGGGWRAAFYARVALALPERFELTGSWLRDADKRAQWRVRYGGRMAENLEDLLRDRPDYVVLSIAKPAIAPVLNRLMRLGTAVLCETPPATCVEDLNVIWRTAQETGVCVQVAEQYPFQPYYAAWKKAIQDGMIGLPSCMSISAVHGYHAISLIRQFLSVGYENAQICARRYAFPVRDTAGRGGIKTAGRTENQRRDRVSIVFESGKTAFFDFSPVQYASLIRARHFSIQGPLGEIDDFTLRAVNQNGQPMNFKLKRYDLGRYGNMELCLHALTLGERCLYLNPYGHARLNDDELAVAEVMERMGQLCQGEGEAVYPLVEALQDTYFALEMERALTQPWEMVHTCTQDWAKGR